ncbi:DUF5590 domain-containing protein [Paenibacillus sp. YYML68]|uniref:cell wall elongation regulator TseB-like domain-containing protein n=1 Tax=Paenibacillus sp. YYML68 TaxID=2909250 RepID=UPI002491DDCF|nr:DUF5590 domain-containing protein [Paenibacillus sp. YYML68]
MSKYWKWGLSFAAMLVASLLLINWLFHVISSAEWNTQRAAVQTAYEKTVLVKTHKVERFVGDQAYTVITGEDKVGRRLYVWVGDEGLRTELAANGLDIEAVKAKVLEKQPRARVLRVTPGIQGDRLIWEVFYKLIPEGQSDEQHFYDYYTFYEGSWIDTWRLTIQ